MRKADWLIPTGLIALSIVPALAGTMRLIQLGGAGSITPENARFFAAPLPVAMHIVAAVIYCVLGAFQFSPRLRQSNPAWHRAAGRLLVACGLIAAGSALWLTQFYPIGVESPARFDGPYLYVIRLLAASTMAVSLCLGLAAAMRRDIPVHRAWMMRAYALGLGAGTQALTHLPWFLFPSIQGEVARTVLMGAGWAINIAIAEWLIARERSKRSA
jgi:uncharacterized membrane protein